MLESIHRFGSSIRNSRFMKKQRWLWNIVEPIWEKAFGAVSRKNGFAARINTDTFRLSYEHAARYDRADHRAYEPEFYVPFVAAIKPGMTVLDVGAHVGIFSLGAAVRVGPTGKVFAFEAAPHTVRTLSSHIAMNGFSHTTQVVPKVVSDRKGEMTFYAFGESMAASVGRANTEELNPEQPKTITPVTVPSISLDEFCADLRPDVIKMDIEGAEYLALRGAERILRSHSVKTFLCEIHPKQMQNCGGSLEELTQYLHDLDYKIVPLDMPNSMGIFHASLVRR